jgi:hypothetical protein
MTPNHYQVDLSLWPSKAQAAEALNISERTLDRRLIACKRIETRMRPRSDGRKPEVVCNPEDVRALFAERKGAVVMPARTAVSFPPQLPAYAGLNVQELARTVQSVMAIAMPAKVDTSKLWLTLKEASAYSGLSMALLQRLARDGAVQAVKDNGWKFRRYGLDSLDDKKLLTRP